MKQLSNKIALLALFLGLFLFIFDVPAQTLGWGRNDEGQIGIGNQEVQAFPVEILAVPDATGIGGGESHTLFLKADGTLLASGLNTTGQLGDGTTISPRISPVAVSGLTNIVKVANGFGLHSAALRSDGTVWSWGYNLFGQLGNGTTETTGCRCVPTPMPISITNVVQIKTGDAYTLALKADGTVWAWGDNIVGQLGNGTMTNSSSPVQVGVGVAGFNNIVAVSAGESDAIALKSDGTVWIWGRNLYGQVGNGTRLVIQRLPVQNTTLSNIVQVSAGSANIMALRSDGTVWIWGNNTRGQIGNGATSDFQLFPVQNSTLTNIVEIEAGGGFTAYARRRGGTVWAWGYSLYGQLGTGGSQTTGCQCQPSPLQSSVGAGNAGIGAGFYQGFSLNPVIPVTVGANQQLHGKNVEMFFTNVTGAGDVSYTAVDPTTTGLTVPPGYVIQGNQPAYEITKTATTSGNILVCLAVNKTNPADYSLLKILHEEGGVLVDRTTSYSATFGNVCSTVSSFSRFVVAQGLIPTAARAMVSGRVSVGKGAGLVNAFVILTDINGNSRTARTNSFGYYRFDDVEVGQTYIVAVRSKQFQFTPQIISVNDNIRDLDFTAIE